MIDIYVFKECKVKSTIVNLQRSIFENIKLHPVIFLDIKYIINRCKFGDTFHKLRYYTYLCSLSYKIVLLYILQYLAY